MSTHTDLVSIDNIMLRDSRNSNLIIRMLEFCNESITLVDHDSEERHLVYINRQFEKVTGYSREEVLGRNCRFLQGPDTDPAAVEEIKTAIHNFESCRVTLLNYRKDGEPFWNRLSLFPFHDPDTGKRYFAGFQLDVTTEISAMREIEEKLHTIPQEEELAHRSMAHMAHDLRNGLGYTINSMELITTFFDSLSRDELLEMARNIFEKNMHILSIMNGLLDYNRYRRGYMVPLQSRFNIKAMLDDEIRYAENAAHKKQIEFHLEIKAVDIYSDWDQLSSAFRNILSNAIKFTPVGGSIEILCQPEGNDLLIRIVDSGVGCDQETLNMLNRELPVRSMPGTAGEKGFGLGSMISVRAIKNLGGEIAYANTATKGLAVSIRLPQSSSHDLT